MIVGTANTMKLAGIDKPIPINIPPINGPTIAPILPAPTAQPTPVARISTGYICVAKAYIPTNPPCMPKPSNPKSINTIADPLKSPNNNINVAVNIKNQKIVFCEPNLDAKYPCKTIPQKAPKLKTVPA